MDKRMRRISRRNKRLRLASILSLVLILGTVLCILFFRYLYTKNQAVDVKEASLTLSEMGAGRIVDDLLTPNKYSRPQIPLEKVKGVVVHYTANPGTGAKANRNYFNNLPKINKEKGTNTYASSNFIIDIDGKILRIVPETEVAYASNERNQDTISIECCYVNEDGSFTEPTYESLVWLLSILCRSYQLDTNEIIRHYDVTGKNCPKYYVEHEKEWTRLKEDVDKEIKSAQSVLP